MKEYIIGILFLMQCILVWGQAPITTQLDYNPQLQGRQLSKQKQMKQVDTVSLPFIDDFSYYYQTPYPSTSLWMDNMVFVNNNYPVEPRSNGVATFDALDATGQIYEAPNSSFYADTLTSCPVDLGESGTEHVYLSFFYQPQGIGDSPEAGDSLILLFKNGTVWNKIWSTPGTKLHPFKQVMIKVPEDYYYKGFQFRFLNIVSLDNDLSNPGRKSNADHWHIDYVRLDKNRNENDTSMIDVAMIKPLTSIIKGYRSMPWRQFEIAFNTQLEGHVNITYRNNDIIGYLVDRNLIITDLYRSIVTVEIESGAENIFPDEVVNFQQDVINPFDTPSKDSALFELKSYLVTDSKDRKENDTVRYIQHFKNYFARDDGVPETGYGYSGINAQGCAVACRYETFMPDSLQAVAIYFNSVANNASSRYLFQIAIWKDDYGKPGEQIYLSYNEYSPDRTGQFVTYKLEEPVYVTKYYWIGWQQVTSGYLNAGFDRNYNDKGNLWYNKSGTWEQDNNDGTLMIRPMLGKRADFPTTTAPPEIHQADIKLYPNPTSQYLNVIFETSDPSEYVIEIYGQTGRLYYQQSFSKQQVNVGDLNQGVYILRLVHKRSGRVQSQKFLIYR